MVMVPVLSVSKPGGGVARLDNSNLPDPDADHWELQRHAEGQPFVTISNSITSWPYDDTPGVGTWTYRARGWPTGVGGLFAPTNLAGEEVAGPDVSLTWTDQTEGEFSHLIYRSADEAGFIEWAEVGPGVESWVDDTVSDNTSYEYYLRAYDGTNRGPPSDTIVVVVGTP